MLCPTPVGKRVFSLCWFLLVYLSFRTGSRISSVAAQEIYNFPLDFYTGGMQLLAHLIDNNDLYNQILDHGCHCGRLDPFASHDNLGGTTVLDGLDEIRGGGKAVVWNF